MAPNYIEHIGIAVANLEEAKAYYEKALKAEPRFLWVKNELYPELIRKMNEKR